jgi:hypothetical protein
LINSKIFNDALKIAEKEPKAPKTMKKNKFKIFLRNL